MSLENVLTYGDEVVDTVLHKEVVVIVTKKGRVFNIINPAGFRSGIIEVFMYEPKKKEEE